MCVVKDTITVTFLKGSDNKYLYTLKEVGLKSVLSKRELGTYHSRSIDVIRVGSVDQCIQNNSIMVIW